MPIHIAGRIERFFASIGAFLEAALFRPTPTIHDDMIQRRKAAQKIIAECDSLIRRAQYQRYMARSEMEAVEAWEHTNPQEKS